MPDRLWFTDDDEANAPIAQDPMALLIGFDSAQALADHQAAKRSHKAEWSKASGRAG